MTSSGCVQTANHQAGTTKEGRATNGYPEFMNLLCYAALWVTLSFVATYEKKDAMDSRQAASERDIVVETSQSLEHHDSSPREYV